LGATGFDYSGNSENTAVDMNMIHLNQPIQIKLNADTIGPLGDVLTGANVPMELMGNTAEIFANAAQA